MDVACKNDTELMPKIQKLKVTILSGMLQSQLGGSVNGLEFSVSCDCHRHKGDGAKS